MFMEGKLQHLKLSNLPTPSKRFGRNPSTDFYGNSNIYGRQTTEQPRRSRGQHAESQVHSHGLCSSVTGHEGDDGAEPRGPRKGVGQDRYLPMWIKIKGGKKRKEIASLLPNV